MIVLVDTSIWIAHFRQANLDLVDLLSDGIVLMHSGIAGELACGSLKNRTEVMFNLCNLPFSKAATNVEAMQFIEDHQLWGRGLGWIDVHLLASSLLSSCRFWTLDKKLAIAAEDLGVRYN